MNKWMLAASVVSTLGVALGAMAAAPAGGRAVPPSPDPLKYPAEALAASKALKLPEPVLLWEKGAPGQNGDSDEDKPAIYPFLPSKEKNTGCAIVVAPGGAFTHRAMDNEGVLFAKWFNDRGIAAFVLRYRISPLYNRNISVQDGHRSVQFVRAHAAEYGISPDRVGTIGFSAGSEMLALMAGKPVDAKADAEDPIERQSSRMNFMVLGYGSSNIQVNRQITPPTFFFCTAEDRSHASGMINLYYDMYQAQIPAEIHIFPNGEHGIGLAEGDRQVGVWPELMYNWIRANNYLTSEKRASVHGHVMLDGKALPHGSITFVPVAGTTAKPGETASPLTAYILNTDTPTADFSLKENVGPVPGKYKVEIRQDGQVWVSNNRDPARDRRIGMTPDQRAAFIREPGWGVPTIDGFRLYTKAKPGDATDLIIEVKPGDNDLGTLEISSK